MSAEIFKPKLEATTPLLEQAVEITRGIITPARLLEMTQRLSQVYAPSGLVVDTLGPEINRIVNELDLGNRGCFVPDYKGSVNPAILIGNHEGGLIIPHFVLAHGDEVSYNILNNGSCEVVLSPLCSHRQNPRESGVSEIRFPGTVLRYTEISDAPFLEQVASGEVVTDVTGKILFVVSHGPEGEIKRGDRVVFNPNPRLELLPDGDTIRGLIDNRLGAAMAILSGACLAQLSDIPAIIFIFDDQEEGVVPEFGLGAKRLATLNQSDPLLNTSLYIVCDLHDVPRGKPIPDGALVARVVSHGKGPMMDETRFTRMKMIMEIANQIGVTVYADEDFGNSVYTSRSSDQGLRAAGIPDARILVAGYGGIEPHHGDGKPTEASLKAGVATAQFLTILAVLANKRLLD